MIYRISNRPELYTFTLLAYGKHYARHHEFLEVPSNRFHREPSLQHEILYWARYFIVSFLDLFQTF